MKYYNLTIPQQNIWNLQKYYEDTAIANLCGAVFYNEKRNSMLLQQSIRIFIENQAGMRLQFYEKTEVKQYISDEIMENIPVLSFASIKEFDRYAEDFAKKPMELIDSVMYRFVVFHVENTSGVLVVLNHLIADAWTFGLMAEQLNEAYINLEKGENCTFLKADYTDFVKTELEYLSSTRYVKDKDFWGDKYKKLPEKSVIKISSVEPVSVKARRFTKAIALPLERNIYLYCKKYSVTQAVLFETALIIYLSRINPENQSVTIGVPILNRCNFREKKMAGMFVSTLPLTITIKENMTVLELAKKIAKEHMNLFRHQKYPYDRILKTLREEKNYSGNLYDVMISYQNAKTNIQADTKWYSNGYCEVPFVMNIDNRDGKDTHIINVDYQVEVFQDEREIIYIIERLEYVIGQITEGNIELVRNINLIPEYEYKKIINDFNNTAVDYKNVACIHEWFSEQAFRTPKRTAFVFENKIFTYQKLDEMSNSLAYHLRKKGVWNNDIVAILSERSWYIIVAVLAVLKAGGAFVMLDPSFPQDRIEYMLRTIKASFVLSYGENVKSRNETIKMDELSYEGKTDFIDNINDSNSLCYINFTSGSTGKPKGVQIRHGNLINTIKWRIGNYSFTNKNIVDISPITTDTFIEDVFSSLLAGGILYLVKDNRSLQSISDVLIKLNQFTIMTTPTYFSVIYSSLLIDKWDEVILVGEKLTDTFKNEIIDNIQNLHNEYGPSECTICSTYQHINKERAATIGRPIANTQIYILNVNREVVPIGVAGEICIAGNGVGKGYLNSSKLTKESFILNPFVSEDNKHGEIMYCTGDLARFRMDGEIEYLGRIDAQVKIRGLRIELEEIENIMSGFNGIHLAAVADKYDKNNRQYLVGYYTSEYVLDEKEIRQYLSEKLPQYMIPNYFMYLEQIPITASGKIERRNLPVPDFSVRTMKYVSPVSAEEKKLCDLLKKLLKVEKIGIQDNFFEIGGDSLTAIEYVTKASAESIIFSIQNVFDYPTVELLCDFLAGKDIEKASDYNNSQFEKYQKLLDENKIDDKYIPKKNTLGNVFLTGATGFLGAHILEQLIREETGKIYCLIRSGERKNSSEKLKDILKYYFGEQYELEDIHRIIIITGDLEQEYLPEDMPQNINTVIHAAANVKHYGAYEDFQRLNVKGTKHMIKYAKENNAKLIHISTLSVSGNDLEKNDTFFASEKERLYDETSFYVGQSLNNVYVHSKFEAEKAVFEAMLEGLDAKIIRVGNLTNRFSDYRFQPNYNQNAFLRKLKAILEFGKFPDYLLSASVEFSPVDLTAKGIVKIAQYAGRQCVFHLYNDDFICFEQFIKLLREIDIPMEIMNGIDFNYALQKTVQHAEESYILEAVQNDLDKQGKLVFKNDYCIGNDFTKWFLNKVGFEWEKIDEEYVKGYINYFKEEGYLKL